MRNWSRFAAAILQPMRVRALTERVRIENSTVIRRRRCGAVRSWPVAVRDFDARCGKLSAQLFPIRVTGKRCRMQSPSSVLLLSISHRVAIRFPDCAIFSISLSVYTGRLYDCSAITMISLVFSDLSRFLTLFFLSPNKDTHRPNWTVFHTHVFETKHKRESDAFS